MFVIELTHWTKRDFIQACGSIDLWRGLRDRSIIDMGDGLIGLLWRGEI